MDSSEVDIEAERMENIKKLEEQKALEEKNTNNDIKILENKSEHISETDNTKIEALENPEQEIIKPIGEDDTIKEKIKTVDNETKVKKQNQKEEILRKSRTQKEIDFLKSYYEDIWEQRLEQAYEKSSKNVSYNTYYGWYKDIESIKINGIRKVDNTENQYFIDVDLIEKWEITNYTIVKSVWWYETKDFKIIDSKTLSSSSKSSSTKTLSGSNSYDYISNTDLKKEIDSGVENYIILDAREDIEAEVGSIPWSTHIRFAELKNGDYEKLDKNKIIYVYCYSWIRGKQVSQFLKEKWFKSRYLENWWASWYAFWWYWEGKARIYDIYSQPQYQKIIMEKELKSSIKNGAILVDSRWLKEYKAGHLENSINVPLVDLPKEDWDDYIKQIPKNSETINICDSYLNCFYAKIVWMELEKRWYKFLWVYSLVYH